MSLPEEGPVLGIRCTRCGEEKLRIENRFTLTAKPLGTHSLSGNQLKVSAIGQEWPFMVCDGCGAECKGKIR